MYLYSSHRKFVFINTFMFVDISEEILKIVQSLYEPRAQLQAHYHISDVAYSPRHHRAWIMAIF